MPAIPVKQFVEELTAAINSTLETLPDDKSREAFLNALADGFFEMPYHSEEVNDE